MKFYYLTSTFILVLILGSCVSLQDPFSKKAPLIKKDKVVKMNNCPKSKIPYKTSFIKNINIGAKVIKVTSSCNFVSRKNISDNKGELIVKFSIYLNVILKDKMIKKELKEINTYVAIVNEQNKILTKLLAPVSNRDIKNINKTNVKIVLERDFKFIYNKKNNSELKILYGFQI